jgi:hypothetical protein
VGPVTQCLNGYNANARLPPHQNSDAYRIVADTPRTGREVIAAWHSPIEPIPQHLRRRPIVRELLDHQDIRVHGPKGPDYRSLMAASLGLIAVTSCRGNREKIIEIKRGNSEMVVIGLRGQGSRIQRREARFGDRVQSPLTEALHQYALRSPKAATEAATMTLVRIRHCIRVCHVGAVVEYETRRPTALNPAARLEQSTPDG